MWKPYSRTAIPYLVSFPDASHEKEGSGCVVVDQMECNNLF